MNHKNILNIIIKRKVLFIILPLITGLIAAFASLYIVKPSYEASTSLYIINRTQGGLDPLVYDDVLVGEQLVKDYKELIKSRSILKSVISQLNISNLSADRLSKKITVSSKNDTRLLEIKVQDENAERAKLLADKLAEEFSKKVIELMKVENAKFVDKAEVPLEPVSPKPMINTLIGLLAGFLGAVGIVFSIEYMDTTLKTQEDVENMLELPVLGVIPLIKAD